MQTRRFIPAAAAVMALVMTACAPVAQKPEAVPAQPVAIVKDGELKIPADYKSWPKFLSAVQRADAGQVREIYMNPTAAKATAGGEFPNGTVFVMENFAAAVNADGSQKKGADGKLVKGDLLRVFVMGKGQGWGESAPAGLKNGDWVYAGYLPSGAQSPEPASACRACHLPLTSKDFVFRYDEHFSQVAAK